MESRLPYSENQAFGRIAAVFGAVPAIRHRLGLLVVAQPDFARRAMGGDQAQKRGSNHEQVG